MRPALDQYAPTPPPRPRPALRCFTLIELLVVLTIIVILLSLAAGGLILATTGAQQKQTRITLHALASLAAEYKARTGNVVPLYACTPTGADTITPVPGNTYNLPWASISNYYPQGSATGATPPNTWRAIPGGDGVPWAVGQGFALGATTIWKMAAGNNRTYQSLQPANTGHTPPDPAWWEDTPAYVVNIRRFCGAAWQIPDLQPQLLALGTALRPVGVPPGQNTPDIMEARDAWGTFIDYRLDAAGNAYFVSAGPDGFFGADGDGNHSVDNLDSRQIK